MTAAPTHRPSTHWTEFRALGTYVHLQTSGDLSVARRRAEEILGAVDLACSRFRPDSDLSRVNAAQGSWTRVSPLFLAALRVALTAASDTDGILDPCLGRNLVEVGYDVDFHRVRARADLRSVPAPAPAYGSWTGVVVDDSRVKLPSGIALDLGATAKAWASDLVAHSIAEESGAAVLISLGGDVSVAGAHPGGDGWPIEITERPGGTGETVPADSIWLGSGGLATSSTQVRRWRAGGSEYHHVIDPRTGRPADGPWRTVTATGPSCVAANVASTAALVLGAAAVDWLDGRTISARLIAHDGSAHLVGEWPTSPTSGEPCLHP